MEDENKGRPLSRNPSGHNWQSHRPPQNFQQGSSEFTRHQHEEADRAANYPSSSCVQLNLRELENQHSTEALEHMVNEARQRLDDMKRHQLQKELEWLHQQMNQLDTHHSTGGQMHRCYSEGNTELFYPPFQHTTVSPPYLQSPKGKMSKHDHQLPKPKQNDGDEHQEETKQSCEYVSMRGIMSGATNDLPYKSTREPFDLVQPEGKSRIEHEITTERTSKQADYFCTHNINKDIKGPWELCPEANKVKELLKRGLPLHKRLSLNILMVGQPGVGKSSLVNSLLMALNPMGYLPMAERGGGLEGGADGRTHSTLNLESWKIFDFLDYGSPEKHFQLQPIIWDMTGLDDKKDEKYEVILRNIIEGRIREGYNMTKLFSQPDEKALMKKAEGKDPSRTIDIVVYVHAAPDPVPANLTRYVLNSCRPNKQGERNVPVVIVITKRDKLCKANQCYRLETLQEKLLKQLGIDGIEEDIFHSSTYCHQVTPGMSRNGAIDKILCAIWMQILLRVRCVKEPPRKTKTATLKRLVSL